MIITTRKVTTTKREGKGDDDQHEDYDQKGHKKLQEM
jgi:hypothetical protein